MATLKTQANNGDAGAYIDSISNGRRRRDAEQILRIMSDVTGEQPVMWGTSIVGFGHTTYTNTSGTHDWFRIGFSARKASLTVYITEGFEPYRSLLDRLGPHTTSKSCLYIKDLSAVDGAVLRAMIAQAAR